MDNKFLVFVTSLLFGFITFVVGLLGLSAHNNGSKINIDFDPDSKKLRYNELPDDSSYDNKIEEK